MTINVVRRTVHADVGTYVYRAGSDGVGKTTSLSHAALLVSQSLKFHGLAKWNDDTGQVWHDGQMIAQVDMYGNVWRKSPRYGFVSVDEDATFDDLSALNQQDQIDLDLALAELSCDLCGTGVADLDSPLVDHAGDLYCSECYENATCATCDKTTIAGVWTTCDDCSKPVCDQCAAQLDGVPYCKGCFNVAPIFPMLVDAMAGT